jgi:hypothetical protein
MQGDIMLNVTVLSVVMPSVAVLNTGFKLVRL